jgi:hypothetical protein
LHSARSEQLQTSGYTATWLGFEPVASKIQVYSVTSPPTFSINYTIQKKKFKNSDGKPSSNTGVNGRIILKLTSEKFDVD